MKVFIAIAALLLTVWACKKLQNDSVSNQAATHVKPTNNNAGYVKTMTDTIYDSGYVEDSTYTYIGYNANDELYSIDATRSNDTLFVTREAVTDAFDTTALFSTSFINVYATAKTDGDSLQFQPKGTNRNVVLIPFDPSEEGGDYISIPNGGKPVLECKCNQGGNDCGPPELYGIFKRRLRCANPGLCPPSLCIMHITETFQARPTGLFIDIGSSANTGINTIVFE